MICLRVFFPKFLRKNWAPCWNSCSHILFTSLPTLVIISIIFHVLYDLFLVCNPCFFPFLGWTLNKLNTNVLILNLQNKCKRKLFFYRCCCLIIFTWIKKNQLVREFFNVRQTVEPDISVSTGKALVLIFTVLGYWLCHTNPFLILFAAGRRSQVASLQIFYLKSRGNICIFSFDLLTLSLLKGTVSCSDLVSVCKS